MTANDQKREKWESYLIEIFLFEICPGVDTIQKQFMALSVLLYILCILIIWGSEYQVWRPETVF